VLVSTLLVVATAASVAAVAHALGLPWGPAWVLGAAVAPTDATAMGAIAHGLPRRTVTTLRAESLVNDGTALVICGLAVGVTVGEQVISTGGVAWLTAVAYVGGAAAGLAVAWLSVRVRRGLDNPLQENVVSIVAPFLAFLVAELVHASGVLAVVVCGLPLSQGRFGPDTEVEEERRPAQRIASEEAVAALPDLAAQLGTSGEVHERLRREYEKHLRKLHADNTEDAERFRAYHDEYTALRLAVIAHKRATGVRLRDERRIDDTVLRQPQADLDIEEVRLSRREVTE
jgi:hypothetical protein